ncbi:MAG TPA: hypothetical protein VIH58_09645, partial [Chthoniobacterales bacterium]
INRDNFEKPPGHDWTAIPPITLQAVPFSRFAWFYSRLFVSIRGSYWCAFAALNSTASSDIGPYGR